MGSNFSIEPRPQGVSTQMPIAVPISDYPVDTQVPQSFVANEPQASQVSVLASQQTQQQTQNPSNVTMQSQEGLPIFADGRSYMGKVTMRPKLNIAFPGISGTMVMDVEKNSMADGAKVVLWPRNSGKNQAVTVMTDDKGERGKYYYFMFDHSGLWLNYDQATGVVIQSKIPGRFSLTLAGFGLYLRATETSKIIAAGKKGEPLMMVDWQGNVADGVTNAGVSFMNAATGGLYLNQVAETCMNNWGSVTLASAGLLAVGVAGYYIGKRSYRNK